MNEEMKKISRLEEQYEEEKKPIEQQMQWADDQVHAFRRETDEIFEAVRYYTRNDEIDLERIHWQMMDLNDEVHHEGRRYYDYLDDQLTELKQELDRNIDRIEEEAWQKRQAEAKDQLK